MNSFDKLELVGVQETPLESTFNLHCEPKKHQNVFYNILDEKQPIIIKFDVYCPE